MSGRPYCLRGGDGLPLALATPCSSSQAAPRSAPRCCRVTTRAQAHAVAARRICPAGGPPPRRGLRSRALDPTRLPQPTPLWCDSLERELKATGLVEFLDESHIIAPLVEHELLLLAGKHGQIKLVPARATTRQANGAIPIGGALGAGDKVTGHVNHQSPRRPDERFAVNQRAAVSCGSSCGRASCRRPRAGPRS